ncbi:MFS transporter [Alkalicoccus luteus]|uniref:MFS transporter n=1 Tax=Alkalicoccus luteus TaxID=1237094 RepID=A0A969TUD4_9BACI|nr:MFS transporter [Alkalicoccus luteus]NJP37225.1 MFS transporter [Alkalicoccus luteus]
MNAIHNLKGTLLFFHASMTIIISYLPVYFQSMGLTPSEIGTLMAVGPAAAIAAQPFWGFMSDKWKTVRLILLICLAGAAAVGAVMFQIEQFILLIPAVYLFFSFLSPAGGLGDSLAQKKAIETGISFGSIRMWGSIGFATASLGGGYVLSYTGINSIYYVFLLFITGAFLLAFRSPDSVPAAKKASLKDAFKLLGRKKLLLFLAFVLSISLTHRMNDTFIGLYMVELGGNEALIGWAWFIGVSAEAAMFAGSVYWMRRFQPLTLISIAAAVYAVRWMLLASAQDPYMVLLIQPTHGIAFAMLYLTAIQYVGKLAPKELMSTAHLLLISVFFGVSGVIGSSFGGAVIEAADVRFLYVLMAVMASAGFIGSLFYRKHQDEPHES